jgi:hypothetical protein
MTAKKRRIVRKRGGYEINLAAQVQRVVDESRKLTKENHMLRKKLQKLQTHPLPGIAKLKRTCFPNRWLRLALFGWRSIALPFLFFQTQNTVELGILRFD